MTAEARVGVLEQALTRLETDRDGHADKIDQVRLEVKLPDIIARAVAPLPYPSSIISLPWSCGNCSFLLHSISSPLYSRPSREPLLLG